MIFDNEIMEERLDFINELYKSEKLLKAASYSIWYSEYFSIERPFKEWIKWENLYGLKILKDESLFNEVKDNLIKLNLDYLNISTTMETREVLNDIRDYLFSFPITDKKLYVLETCYTIYSKFFRIDDGDLHCKFNFQTNKLSKKLFRYVIKRLNSEI